MKKYLSIILVFIASSSIAQDNCVSKISSNECVLFDIVHHGFVSPEQYIFTWNFGDGMSGDGPKVNHCYAQIGNYEATLSLTDRETGGYFENEIVFDVAISQSLELLIVSKDTINAQDRLNPVFALSREEAIPTNIQWSIDGEVLEGEQPTVMDLPIGDHLLRVTMEVVGTPGMCTEKVIHVRPGGLFEYETRYLKDYTHIITDSLIWSGNHILVGETNTSLSSFFFGLDDASLSDENKRIIANNVNKLKSYPEAIVEVGVFTHTEGNFDHNRKLSLSRAKAIAAYMIKSGFPKDKVQIGDPSVNLDLKNTCTDLLDCTYLDPAFNQRADTKIISLVSTDS